MDDILKKLAKQQSEAVIQKVKPGVFQVGTKKLTFGIRDGFLVGNPYKSFSLILSSCWRWFYEFRRVDFKVWKKGRNQSKWRKTA